MRILPTYCAITIKSLDFFQRKMFTKTLESPIARVNRALITSKIFAFPDITTSRNLIIIKVAAQVFIFNQVNGDYFVFN